MSMEQLFLSVLGISAGTSVLIFLMLLTVPLFGKRYRQKWRYWVWLLLAVRLLIPYNIPQTLPAVSVPLPEKTVTIRHNAPDLPLDDVLPSVPKGEEMPTDVDLPVETIPVPAETRPAVTPAEKTPAVSENTVTVMQILTAVWAGGILVCAAFSWISYLHFLRRARRWSIPVGDPDRRSIFDEVKNELHITRSIGFYQSALIGSPLMIGFFRPTVLLPKREISEDDLHMVLRHELLHYKRHDLWYKLVFVAARSLHWFNPLVWILLKTADRDLEIACDEDVVKNRDSDFRHLYCETILRVVRSDRARKPLLSTGFAMNKSVMKRRFLCALDQKPKRIGALALAIVCLSSAVCGTLIGCEQQKNPSPDNPSSSVSSEPGNSSVDSSQPSSDEELPPVRLSEEYQKSSYDVLHGETFPFQENAPVTDFMQTKRCVEYLKESYPNIDDWEVMAQFSTYRRRIYDNFSSEWWTLYRYVVLVTNQNGQFNVLSLCYDTSYELENRVITSIGVDIVTRSTASWDSADVGKLKNAEIFCAGGQYSSTYSLYLPKEKILLLCRGESPIIRINDVNPESRFTVSDCYELPIPDGVDNVFRGYYDDPSKPHLVLQSGSQVTDLGAFQQYAKCTFEDTEQVLLFTENGITSYHWSDGIPLTQAYTIPAEKITSGKLHFWDYNNYEVITDRKNDNRHAVMYFDESEKEPTIRILAFDSEGNILSKSDTGISSAEVNNRVPTWGLTALSGGVAYFNYQHPYGYSITYAADIRDGKNHKPQVVKYSLPYDYCTFTDSVDVSDAQIEEMLVMFGAEKGADGKLYTQERSLYHLDGFSPYYTPDALYLWRCYSYSRFDGLTDSERAEKYRHPNGESEGLFFPQEEYDNLIGKYFEDYSRADAYDRTYGGYRMSSDAISGSGEKKRITVDRVTEYSEEASGVYKYLRVYLTLTGENGKAASYVLTVSVHPDESYRFCHYLSASLYQ